MSNWKLVRLNFGRSPVHFGELGIGIEETSERVRSDTLFSAWISAYAKLFGGEKVAELLNKFSKQGDDKETPVKISSTFIYSYTDEDDKTGKGEQYTYYLPRPLKFPPGYPKEDLSFFKAYKKLAYLPLEIWQRWYQGKGFTDVDRQELEKKIKQNETKGDLEAAKAFEYSKTFKKEKYPKVAIDRVTAATNFYHTGLTQFQYEQNSKGVNKQSGLYFLLHFTEVNSELEDSFRAALNLLGEEGLGGERSSGAGRFTVDYWGNLPEPWKNIKLNNKESYHCLLSLFWNPSIPDKLLKNSSYEIIERGGWIGSHLGRQLRRKKIHMFTEGSVFASETEGSLADVTPSQLITNGKYQFHPIYRSGISLSIPINVQENES